MKTLKAWAVIYKDTGELAVSTDGYPAIYHSRALAKTIASVYRGRKAIEVKISQARGKS